ncbi:MAG TPA: hypothetical protein VK577_26130 [Bradyrhizobium sp.]|nr:hypothetical protein [Bradyrhizobium sp.]
MVENGKKCRDEDDCRQDLKREEEAKGRALPSQLAKYKLGAFEGVTQEPVHSVARRLKYPPPDFGL